MYVFRCNFYCNENVVNSHTVSTVSYRSEIIMLILKIIELELLRRTTRYVFHNKNKLYSDIYLHNINNCWLLYEQKIIVIRIQSANTYNTKLKFSIYTSQRKMHPNVLVGWIVSSLPRLCRLNLNRA